MMRVAATSLLAAALLANLAHAAAPNMREGLWEHTTKVDVPGMPAGMPPQVEQRCVTRKDLQDPRKTTPGSSPRESRCKTTDYKLQGNTASWKMACEGKGAMTGSGSITYTGTSYSGTQTLSMRQGGQAQTMTMHYAGKYLGACRK